MNLQKMMAQAQSLQKKMEEMQNQVAAMEIEGSCGGGMVVIAMTGKGEAKRLKIDPKLIDPNDSEMLEDLIIAAINDAKAKSESELAKKMGDVTGGLNLPPGFKLPF